jgi:hypothetical protein
MLKKKSVLTSTVIGVIVVGAKSAERRLGVVGVGAEAPKPARPERHDGLPGRGVRVRVQVVTVCVRGVCGRGGSCARA